MLPGFYSGSESDITVTVKSDFTWFLNHSIAGVCYFLPFGLVWVLVVVEVAINSSAVSTV